MAGAEFAKLIVDTAKEQGELITQLGIAKLD
jgi:hypothetical protein